MHRCLLFLLLVFAGTGSGFAQQAQLSGSLKDTVSYSTLEHASVVLLRAEDSVLAGFSRAQTDGQFTVRADSSGKYILLIGFPGFATYTDQVNLDKPQTDAGTIYLRSREHLIKEVVITRRMAAIKVVGDTTEYAADSFKVAEGATVEDLLKKLPGIQVDKTGKITAQGETVNKLYVDGEEFFTDDPAVVTKNMQSKAVSSVQVYDKKSETAAFTGIDDGIREKVINLKLKDSMKRGYFEKVELGGGTDKYYQNKGMINAFKGKRKVSAYGILSTTAETGLDWQEANKYGGTDNSFTFDEETGQWSGDWESRGNSYNGRGLPKTIAGGGHYSNKWNEGKNSLTANYKAQQLDINGSGTLNAKYLLPDSSYFTKNQWDQFTRENRQNLGGKYSWTLDSLTTLVLTASGSKANNIYQEQSFTRTEGGDGAIINQMDNRNNNTSNRQLLKTALSWQQKFRKKGRSLMVDINGNLTDYESDGMLQSYRTYYNQAFSDSTVQHKTQDDAVRSFGSNANYTEPLSKKFFLALNYGAGISNSRSERFSYNRLPGTGDFNATPDSLYSSDYAYRVGTQKGGATLRYNSTKWNLGLGMRVFHTNFLQEDHFRNTGSFNRTYYNWAPQANVIWNRSRMQSLRFYYNGSTRQPSITQLQPFRQNSDPLNVAIGNPDLKQEFAHNINLSYNNYKALSGSYVYANAGFSLVQDAINLSQNIDALGRRTYQYINNGSNVNIWSWMGKGFKLKKADLDGNLNGNINYNSYQGFVNGVANTTSTTQYGLSFQLSKDWEKDEKSIHDVSLKIGGSYRQNRSTLSTQTPNFWSSEISASANDLLFWKIRLINSIDINLRQRLSESDTRYNTVVWNASLSRKILKRDAAEIRLSVFDIFNQNLGFYRNVTNTVISEEAYTTIRRYGMLSLIWNFSHSPAGNAPIEEED